MCIFLVQLMLFEEVEAFTYDYSVGQMEQYDNSCMPLDFLQDSNQCSTDNVAIHVSWT